MKNVDKVKKFVALIEKIYPELHFRYEYDADDKWHRIYHTGSKDIEQTVGTYMDILFFRDGILNIYFDKEKQ